MDVKEGSQCPPIQRLPLSEHIKLMELEHQVDGIFGLFLGQVGKDFFQQFVDFFLELTHQPFFLAFGGEEVVELSVDIGFFIYNEENVVEEGSYQQSILSVHNPSEDIELLLNLQPVIAEDMLEVVLIFLRVTTDDGQK